MPGYARNAVNESRRAVSYHYRIISRLTCDNSLCASYTVNTKKAISGFTVVELSVVIVIIGILASITLVSYGGMQARTMNAQTVTSANQWLKTLKMYQSRNGGYPTTSTCLGEGYKYAADNQGNGGVGMCR